MKKVSVKRILDANLLDYKVLAIHTDAETIYISIEDIIGEISYWEDYFIIFIEPSVPQNRNAYFIGYDSNSCSCYLKSACHIDTGDRA